MNRLLRWPLLAASLLLGCGSHSPANDAAFYVSPEGNDANPGTRAAPFQTLERAQKAMEDSDVRRVFLRAGTYSLRATLVLDNAADRNQSWLAYPGETPVLDGRGKLDVLFRIDSVGGITIRWLTFLNARGSGLDIQSSAGDWIDSNSFRTIAAPDTNHAAIYCHFGVSSTRITHNLIEDVAGPGIVLAGGSKGEINSNNLLSGNVIRNVNMKLTDSGGIYLLDRGHGSSGNVISNNLIDGYGANAHGDTKGIYLDDETSSVMVVGNVVRGRGQFGLQIHGGNGNVITKNIFDITYAQRLALYQDAVGAGFPNYGMADNVFTRNLVYSRSLWPPVTLWRYLNQSGGTIALPRVEDNLYYDPSVPLPNAGTILDRRPIVGDPEFRDPTGGDYSTPQHALASSPPIDFVTPAERPGPLANAALDARSGD